MPGFARNDSYRCWGWCGLSLFNGLLRFGFHGLLYSFLNLFDGTRMFFDWFWLLLDWFWFWSLLNRRRTLYFLWLWLFGLWLRFFLDWSWLNFGRGCFDNIGFSGRYCLQGRLFGSLLPNRHWLLSLSRRLLLFYWFGLWLDWRAASFNFVVIV